MTKYLVDTDILINFINGVEKTVELLSNLKPSNLSVSVVSAGEILEGLVDKKEKYELVKKGLVSLKIYKVDLDTAEMFAQERSILRKRGKLLDNMDLLIASTALTHDLTLITGNRKHFERIKSLKVLTV